MVNKMQNEKEQQAINKAIKNHDKYEIRQLCKNNEQLLQYFIDRVMQDVTTLEHIKNIIK